jgi:xylulokinase
VSLIGIDMGSSAVKATAYSENGKPIAAASHNLTPLYPGPGWWETDPEDVWRAISMSMRSLMDQSALRRDPPKAIAVSASGRENFPADSNGNPLANGIMGADIRGAEFEIPPEGSPVLEPWCLSCGHPRQRMDPAFRLKWWRKYHPEILEKTKYFFGWMDFLNFRMTGKIVTDQSSASLYLVYDLETKNWSPERVTKYEFCPDMLPQVPPWGSVIGELKPEVADDWGAPPHVKVAQGCLDLNCAAHGAGVHEIGTACLVSGSYENILIPTDKLPTISMLLRGLSVLSHPCKSGLSVIAVHPTGNAVLNWARDLVDVSVEDMENILQRAGLDPSPVLAIPYLSGSMTYWKDGRKAKGGLIGLTLATSKADVVQAFMESIAYDTANTLSMMSDEGIEVNRIRITGGGARSRWWTQLKADITNKPIEVVEATEPGTLGAALLAGLAIGIYDDMEEISKEYSGTQSIYAPDPKRAALHQERLEMYRQLMGLLLKYIY